MRQRHKGTMARSGILEEHHEAKIHVVLLVTVKQGGAGIVRGELDLGAGLGVDQNDILDDAANVGRRRLSSDRERLPQPAELKTVPVQMQRMIVDTLVDELQAVALGEFERLG